MRLTSLVYTLVAGLITACGGGDDTSAPVAANRISIQGKVTDQAGDAVSGAEVGLVTRDGIINAISDNSGNFDLRAPVTASSSAAFPTVYINKVGYQPFAINYTSLSGGNIYQGSASLTILGSNQSAPNLGYLVHHVGNDEYNGAANSQFQRNTEGTTVQLKIEDFDAKLISGFKTARITLLLKGVEPVSNGCEDDIILSQVSADGAFGANITMKLRPSPIDGSYGADSYSLSLAGFEVGKNTFVAIRSQPSCTGTDNYDDFEFTKVLVTYQ